VVLELYCHFEHVSSHVDITRSDVFAFVTGTSVDGADLKLAFAALTTTLLEAAKLDKDELSLRYIYIKAFCSSFIICITVVIY